MHKKGREHGECEPAVKVGRVGTLMRKGGHYSGRVETRSRDAYA